MTRTAVVIMAKEPAAGRTKTRLSPPLSPSGAARLYEALLNDTIALVGRVPGVALAVAITPAPAGTASAKRPPPGGWRPRVPPGAIVLPVEGADIGWCLDLATSTLFARGFSRVIALNSDGPTLPAEYIDQARRLLGRHDVVLGPSADGGYYLIGLREARPGLFRQIAWSTASVLAETTERADRLGLTVARLPPWYDVDTEADLDRLRAELRALPHGALDCTRRFFHLAAVTERRGPREGIAR